MNQISQALSAEARSPDDMRSLRLLECSVAAYGIILIVGSIMLFMMNAVSDQVNNLIAQQNIASLKLWTNLDYYEHHKSKDQTEDSSLPPGLFEALVEFSRGNATLIKTIHRLNFAKLLSSGMEWSKVCQYIRRTDRSLPKPGQPCDFPYFGVDPHTDNRNVLITGMYQIELYQAIRDYAQDQSNFYAGFIGAISTHLLPVAYALLGSFLYAFRSLSAGVRQRRVDRSPDRTSRFLMAGIAGIAISAFSTLIPKDLMLPPLVVAFVVGYSIDVFTTWLDVYVNKLKHAAGA